MRYRFEKTNRSYHSKYLVGLIILITVIIIARIIINPLLLSYVETTLNKIPGYQAHIDDIDLNFLSGGYAINGMTLNKINNKIPVPYFYAKKINIEIHWAALFKGHIVGQIILNSPQLNFVIDNKNNNQQITINSSWQDRVKELYPFRFNQVRINNGEIHLRSFTSDYPFNIYLKNVTAVATNISNIQKNNGSILPTSIIADGKTMDGAQIKFKMTINLLAKQPTFDLDAQLKKMNIAATNQFLREYTKVDVKGGYFSLYMEAAAVNGKITGYVKPLFENLQIMKPNEKLPAHQQIYKAIVAGVAKILQNPQTKAVATKITIAGNINNPQMNIRSLIINLLKNAFIQALLPGIDDSIHYDKTNFNNITMTYGS